MRKRSMKKKGPEKGRRIYLDYAAATPLDSRVSKAMEPYWQKDFGNPGALHREGVRARDAVLEARKSIARILHAKTAEIIFTGSGTEANNLAIFGIIAAREREGILLSNLHAITTTIEHESVLECFRELARRGMPVSYVIPDAHGVVSVEKIVKEITPATVLISVGYVNSEIGTIQPIRSLAKKLSELRQIHGSRPYVHTDASQAATLLNCAVDRLEVDLLTLDAQKMYGPKGIGALYIREGAILAPHIFGGGQERGIRSGTENVPLIVGFAKAYTLAVDMREREYVRLEKLQSLFRRLLKEGVPEVVQNGDEKEHLPSIVNVSLPGRDSEMLSLQLDAAGIAVTTKSACTEGSQKASPVVLALSGDRARAESSLRFSFGRGTTVGEIKKAVEVLARIIDK